MPGSGGSPARAVGPVAPAPASSGQVPRTRLNRGGNRVLCVVALAQARHHPPAQAFIARKRAEGTTWREALRALKRHLARVVFRLLVDDAAQLLQAAWQDQSLTSPTHPGTAGLSFGTVGGITPAAARAFRHTQTRRAWIRREWQNGLPAAPGDRCCALLSCG